MKPILASHAIAPEFIGQTARHAEIAKLHRYFTGCQYDGRPDFFTGRKANGEVVPLRERKPAVTYPIERNATREVVRFTFGDGRFPTIQVKSVEAKQALGGLGLSVDDAKTLQQANADIVEQAGLRMEMRSLQEAGVSCRTAVAILCLRDGKFVVDNARAQDCVATYARKGDASSPVTALTICYQHDAEVPDDKGAPRTVRMWYRRDITDTHDIRFVDVPVEHGKRPIWTVDEAQTVEHGFTFCPVVWTRNLPESFCGSVDGVSIYDGRFDEIDALNFALSQRHRGIVFFGTPQPFETGVEEDDGPEATGRTAVQGYSAGAPFAGVCATSPARVQAPDRVWSYRSAGVNVGLIETTGKAFEVASKHVDDIAARLKQSMGVILASATDTLGKGDMSAKFLALVYAPMLAFVDDLRECWWGACLRPLLEMALRIVMVRKGEGVLIPRAAEVATILARRVVTTVAGPVWVAPEMSPLWGAYFSPSNDDIKTNVETAAKAVESRLISKRDGIAYIANDFSIRDVDAVLDALGEGEADEAESDDKPEVETPDTTMVDIETAPVEVAAVPLPLTATDVAGIVSVNEGRSGLGLAPWVSAEGSLTVTAFQAKNAALVAAAAGAAMGQVVEPEPDAPPPDDAPAADEPPTEDDAADQATDTTFPPSAT